MACKKCGECCRYVAIVTDKLDEDAQKWAGYHGHTWEVREGKTVIFIPNKCKMLAEDSTCRIYDQRPGVCAIIPNVDCRIYQPKGCRYFEDEDANSSK
jgi:Fe-S-cluster containining protein